MSRWLLALLFAFGTVTFLTGCPAEDKPADDAADAVEGAADEAAGAVEGAADEAAGAVDAE